MYFDDGANPWKVEENHIRVFNFDNLSGANSMFQAISAVALLMLALLNTLCC